LTVANKRERLRFAHQYLNDDNFWANIIFSDEKTFESCSNGRVRVYRPIRERFAEQYVCQINRSGRFSVNVWGWISLRALGVCIVIEDTPTAVVYRDILENAILPSVTQVFGNDFTLQHDNCPIHTAHIIYYRFFASEQNLEELVQSIANTWHQIPR
jgi:hypothetical protein